MLLLISVIYLLITGGIYEFTWGSWSVKMRELSKKELDKENLEIEIPRAEEIEKGGIKFLKTELFNIIRDKKDKPLVLKLHRKEPDKKYYGGAVLRQYLETNFFDYVVFLERNKFKGLVESNKLLGQLRHYQTEIENAINDWELDEIKGILRENLRKPVTISLAMNYLKNKKLNVIPITNQDDEFIGILTKNQVNENILINLIKD